MQPKMRRELMKFAVKQRLSHNCSNVQPNKTRTDGVSDRGGMMRHGIFALVAVSMFLAASGPPAAAQEQTVSEDPVQQLPADHLRGRGHGHRVADPSSGPDRAEPGDGHGGPHRTHLLGDGPHRGSHQNHASGLRRAELDHRQRRLRDREHRSAEPRAETDPGADQRPSDGLRRLSSAPISTPSRRRWSSGSMCSPAAHRRSTARMRWPGWSTSSWTPTSPGSGAVSSTASTTTTTTTNWRSRSTPAAGFRLPHRDDQRRRRHQRQRGSGW